MVEAAAADAAAGAAQPAPGEATRREHALAGVEKHWNSLFRVFSFFKF